MHLDNKLSVEEANLGREHRARSQQSQDHAPAVSPGTPTERTVAGGPTPVSRPEQEALRRDARPATHGREQRRTAELALAQMLRLPTDARVGIEVDVANEVVRFQVRHRVTGELIREIPPDEAMGVLHELEELAGALVDRSL